MPYESPRQLIWNPETPPDIIAPDEAYQRTLDTLFSGGDVSALLPADIILSLDEFEDWLRKFAPTVVDKEQKERHQVLTTFVRDVQARMQNTAHMDMTPEIATYVVEVSKRLAKYKDVYTAVMSSEIKEGTEAEREILPQEGFDPSFHTFAEVVEHTRRTLLNIDAHLAKSKQAREYRPVLEEIEVALESMIAPYERYEDDRFTEEFTLTDIKARLKPETWKSFCALIQSDRELFQIITGKDTAVADDRLLLVGDARTEAMKHASIANVFHIALSRSLEDMYTESDDRVRNASREVVDELYGEYKPMHLDEEQMHYELWIQDVISDIKDEKVRALAQDFLRTFRIGVFDVTMRNLDKHRELVVDAARALPNILESLPTRDSIYDKPKELGDKLIHIFAGVSDTLLADLIAQKKALAQANDTAHGDIRKREVSQLFRSKEKRKERYEALVQKEEADTTFVHRLLQKLVDHTRYPSVEETVYTADVARGMAPAVWSYVRHIHTRGDSFMDDDTNAPLKDMRNWMFTAEKRSRTHETNGIPKRNRYVDGVRFRGCNLSGATFSVPQRWDEFASLQLRNVRFEACDMKDVTMSDVVFQGKSGLEQCDMRGLQAKLAKFNDMRIEGCDMRDVHLFSPQFHSTLLKGNMLDGASIQEANLHKCSVEGGTATHAKIDMAVTGSSFSIVDFQGSTVRIISYDDFPTAKTVFGLCNFRDTDLEYGELIHTKMDRCDFRGAKTVNTKVDGTTAWLIKFVDTEGRYDPQLMVEYVKELPEDEAQKDFSGMCAIGIDARGVQLRGKFKDADFREAQFDKMSLYGQNIEGADFEGATGLSDSIRGGLVGLVYESDTLYPNRLLYSAKEGLSSIQLLNPINPLIRGTSLANVNLHSYDLYAFKFIHRDLKNVTFEESEVSDIDFTGSDFSDANLEKATFVNCDFSKCMFDHTNFSSAVFKNCNFSGATFRDCNWEDARIVAPKLEGAKFFIPPDSTTYGPGWPIDWSFTRGRLYTHYDHDWEVLRYGYKFSEDLWRRKLYIPDMSDLTIAGPPHTFLNDIASPAVLDLHDVYMGNAKIHDAVVIIDSLEGTDLAKSYWKNVTIISDDPVAATRILKHANDPSVEVFTTAEFEKRKANGKIK